MAPTTYQYTEPLPPSAIPSDVPSLLDMCGLGEYAPTFEEEGYDDADFLLDVGTSDGTSEATLRLVAADCKMEKKGHVARFLKRCEQLRAAKPSTA